VAVADSYPEVLRAADHVLQTPGGHGALRELFDLVLKKS
jgi:N-acylneuraminate cytidylyltransferase